MLPDPSFHIPAAQARPNQKCLAIIHRQVTLRSLTAFFFGSLRDWGTMGVFPPCPCLRDIVPQTPFFASRLWLVLSEISIRPADRTRRRIRRLLPDPSLYMPVAQARPNQKCPAIIHRQVTLRSLTAFFFGSLCDWGTMGGLPPIPLPEGHCPSDSLLRFALMVRYSARILRGTSPATRPSRR